MANERAVDPFRSAVEAILIVRAPAKSSGRGRRRRTSEQAICTLVLLAAIAVAIR